MRTQFLLSIDADRATTIRQAARNLRVPYSALVEYFLDLADRHCDEQALSEWAKAHQKSARSGGAPKVALKPSEGLTLDFLRAREGEWIPFEELARLTNKTNGVQARALRALESMGLAERREVSGFNNPELKEWHAKGHRGPGIVLWRAKPS